MTKESSGRGDGASPRLGAILDAAQQKARRLRPLRRESPRKVKVNTALRLAHQVAGLDFLNYGLWDPDDSLDREGLRAAQDRYAEELCRWVPAGARSILDVGCGVGSLALKLQRRGLEVEGLSPDPYQQEIFTRRTGLPFHLVRFQEFSADRGYDLILFSESAQYIWLESLFPAARRIAPEAALLFADYFSVEDRGEAGSASGHQVEKFLAASKAAGYEVERQEDVSERVWPTLELAESWLERYGTPLLEIGADALAQKRPWLLSLARRLFESRLEERLDEVRQLVSLEEFQQRKRYLFLLFRPS
jgi:MPBQ/MSBQ methyltransferase